MPSNETSSSSLSSNNDEKNKNEERQEDQSSIRSHAGSLLTGVSDLINENLILVRYTTIASVGLLAAYGLAHTPLFFRYRTVAELSSRHFQTRRSLHCRLVKVLPSTDTATAATAATSSSAAAAAAATTARKMPITCQVRHLSLFERILSKTWYDWAMRVHPSVAITASRPDERDTELFTIQLAGVEDAPLPDYHVGGRSEQWLQRLATSEKTRVTCELLARKVIVSSGRRWNAAATKTNNISRASARRGLESSSQPIRAATASEDEQVAVVKVFYRPRSFQVFSTDLAESLVQYGRASAASDGMFLSSSSNTTTTTTTEQIVDASDQYLQQDAAYMGKLERAEYQAAAASYGMWNDPVVRRERANVVQEVEFQTKAPLWRKVWRWIRGG